MSGPPSNDAAPTRLVPMRVSHVNLRVSFLLAARYLRSKKSAFINVGTLFAILGVAIGVCALATVMSVTGGFQAQFRDKVLGVNAHVLVLKYAAEFREYRHVMKVAETIPDVLGVGPFTINPMMISHDGMTATGVLLKGVDPSLMGKVLDLPKHIIAPADHSIAGLRRPGAAPPRPRPSFLPPNPVDPLDGLPQGSKPPDNLLPPSPSGSGGSRSFGDSVPPSSTGSLPMEAGSDQPPASLLKAIDEAIDKGDKRRAEAEAAEHTKSLEMHRSSHANKDDKALALLDTKRGKPLDSSESSPPSPGKDKDPQGGDRLGHSLVPQGGYQSQLPSDDVLPQDLISDPCHSPELVGQLPGIIVGVTLAKNLKLHLGDCLQVTSPTIGYSYSGGAMHPPVAKEFRVIAIFDAGFEQYDTKLVYTDLYEAQAFYDGGDSVMGVEMRVKDIDQSKRVVQQLEEKLDNPLYHVMDWEELNRGLFTALKIQQIGMSAVLTLIIVVASFTVVATLIMVVLEKKKEIAVLKAMGMSDGSVLLTFVLQGGFTGFMGTALGLLLAVAVCKGLLVYGYPLDPKVYFISRLPVDVRPMEFLITGLISLLISLLATLAPALYAARLPPAEAMRSVE